MSDIHTPRVGRAHGGAGLFILVGLGVFVFAVLQAGLLEPYFERTSTLRVELPEAAVAGLVEGAEVQLFGRAVGQVTAVVISIDEPFHAVAEIDEPSRDFIRSDSRVFVRRQFGIAGAAFLDITRGQGEPLDWDFAVLEAEVQQAPTEDVGVLIEEARERVFPLIEAATRTIRLAGNAVDQLLADDAPLAQMLTRANDVTAAIAAGEGTFGRLLVDDTLVRGLETSVVQLNVQVEALAPLLADLGQAGDSAVRIADNVAAGAEELPALVTALQATLGDLGPVLRATADAIPTFQTTARDAGRSLDQLPDVLRRTGQTLAQLEDLLDALRRSWLVGGGGGSAGDAPTPVDVRP